MRARLARKTERRSEVGWMLMRGYQHAAMERAGENFCW